MWISLSFFLFFGMDIVFVPRHRFFSPHNWVCIIAYDVIFQSDL